MIKTGKAKDVASFLKDEVQLAVFRVGSEEFGVDIMKIMEIIRPQKVTRVPKAPSFMEGIINLRGQVVPVLDMRQRFGVPGERANPKKSRIVIIKVDGSILGVVVDEVMEVIYLRKELIEDTPDSVKGVDAEYLHGVGKMGDRLIFILDIARLLSKEEMSELMLVEKQAGGPAGQIDV